MSYPRRQAGSGRSMASDPTMLPLVADDPLVSSGPQPAAFLSSFPGYSYPSTAAASSSYYTIPTTQQPSLHSAYQYPPQYPTTTSYSYTPSPYTVGGASYNQGMASPYDQLNANSGAMSANMTGDASMYYNPPLGPGSSAGASVEQDYAGASSDISSYGFQNPDGTFTCAYPGCTSEAIIRRACDLRKHYKRHVKTLFCSHEGCPQSEAAAVEGSGFSTKKDRERHERSHEPNIRCEWPGCDKIGSRADNMRDHYRRKHGQR